MKKPTFAEAMAELEEVVRKLEQGDAPLEEAIDLYKNGVWRRWSWMDFNKWTANKGCESFATNVSSDYKWKSIDYYKLKFV